VYDSLALKLFSETCCTDCSCKNGWRTKVNTRASTSNLIISDWTETKVCYCKASRG
jgi:hypothetical protein